MSTWPPPSGFEEALLHVIDLERLTFGGRALMLAVLSDGNQNFMSLDAHPSPRLDA